MAPTYTTKHLPEVLNLLAEEVVSGNKKVSGATNIF
jgi:hypothetical protein